MKLVGGFYLWVLIIVLFFRWASRHEEADRARPHAHRARGPHLGRREGRIDRFQVLKVRPVLRP